MKNLKIMSMLLGGLLALGSITACSSNDDEPEIMKPTGAKVEYVVNLSQDLLNAATVTIYYINANGQQVPEIATTTPWTKTVTFATLPAKAGFSVQPMLKGEPSQEEYDIEADGKMTITVLDQKGDTFGSPFVGSKLELKGQFGPEYLGQFLSRISSRLLDAKAIAEDGTISNTSITWGGNAETDDPNRDTGVSNEGATGTTRSKSAAGSFAD